jgi:hypothetical protein
MQQDPKVLKGGKLSCASNARVPSWRFLKILKEHPDLDRADYEEYIGSLRLRVDGDLYLTEWLTITNLQHEQYSCEIYAVASRLSSLKRTAIKSHDSGTIYRTHPRVAICRLPGGSCPYKAPCFIDGDDSRRAYDVGDGVRWLEDVSAELPIEVDGEVVGRDFQDEKRRTLGW